MDNIKDILTQKTLQPQRLPKFQWQETALEIIKEFQAPKDKISSVFKLCKSEPNLVNRARAYCKETGKCNIQYFFKIINIFK